MTKKRNTKSNNNNNNNKINIGHPSPRPEHDVPRAQHDEQSAQDQLSSISSNAQEGKKKNLGSNFSHEEQLPTTIFPSILAPTGKGKPDDSRSSASSSYKGKGKLDDSRSSASSSCEVSSGREQPQRQQQQQQARGMMENPSFQEQLVQFFHEISNKLDKLDKLDKIAEDLSEIKSKM